MRDPAALIGGIAMSAPMAVCVALSLALVPVRALSDQFVTFATNTPWPENRSEARLRAAEMTEHILLRTGDRKYRFRGQLIALATTQAAEGPCRLRWHRVEIYRTPSGRFLVWLDYRTRIPGESFHDTLEAAGTLAGLRDALEAYDPLRFFTPKNKIPCLDQRAADVLQQRYRAATAEILSVLDPTGVATAP